MPSSAAAGNVQFLLNLTAVGGDSWAKLRLDIGGTHTAASMIDVN